jgi:hypothetical protein
MVDLGRWRRLVCLLATLPLLAVGCGRGYEDENRSLIGEVPVLDGVVMIDKDHYGYCSQDSCLLGSDRSGALLSYSVDTTAFDQQTLVDAYEAQLPGWELSTFEGRCGADEDPVLCDQIVSAVFVREDEEISLNLDNWSVGRFEIHVDARGGELRR